MVDERGSGFFGKGRWGRRVLWENVPVLHRNEDVDGYLEEMLQTWGDEMESFLAQIYALPSQRDPYSVRARDGEGEWFYITESMVWESDHFGQVVRLIGEKDYTEMPETDEDVPPSDDADTLVEWFPWFPYAPIEKAGRWWTVKWGDTDYEVVNVRARNFDPVEIYNEETSLGNELWVAGGDLTLHFDLMTNYDFADIGYAWGALIFPVYLPNVPLRLEQNDTPSPTPWLTANAKLVLQIDVTGDLGDVTKTYYEVPDGVDPNIGNLYEEDGSTGEIDISQSYGTVNYLSGEILMDLRPYLSGGWTWIRTEAYTPIGAKWIVRGYYMEFYPPRMIDFLAQDFGFKNDLNDPEAVQRSTIANLTKYFGLKSSQDSYRIRGEISLFTVVSTPLWYLCDDYIWSQLPEYNQFGPYEGKYYTDVNPRVVRIDDIETDMQFYDLRDSAPSWKTVLDRQLMFEDESDDGYSMGLAFGLDVTQGWNTPRTAPYLPAGPGDTPRPPAEITAVTLLTEAELLSYGLPAGYRVRVQMWRIQANAYNFMRGAFGLTEYDKTGAVYPELSDTVFWIDVEEAAWTMDSAGAITEQDVGHIDYIMGVDLTDGVPVPGPAIGDVAVRYYPEVVRGDCCYCRSNKMVVDLEPTDEALEFYETPEKVLEAAQRLKITKIPTLIPIQVRVLEWRLTQNVVITLDNIWGNGGNSFPVGDDGKYPDYPDVPLVAQPNYPETDSIYEVNLTQVEQRGDMDAPAKEQDMGVSTRALVSVWSATNSTGVSDPDTWYPFLGSPVDITVDFLAENGELVVLGDGDALMSYGDLRYTIEIKRSI